MSKRLPFRKEMIIELFEQHGEASSELIRARPMAGQRIDTKLRVAFNTDTAARKVPGTKIRVVVTFVYREGTLYLRVPNHRAYEIVSDKEAAIFIKERFDQQAP